MKPMLEVVRETLHLQSRSGFSDMSINKIANYICNDTMYPVRNTLVLSDPISLIPIAFPKWNIIPSASSLTRLPVSLR